MRKPDPHNWQLLATVWLCPDPAGRTFGGHLEQWSFVKVNGLPMITADGGERRGLVLRYTPWRMVYISDRLSPRQRDERIGRSIREIERLYRLAHRLSKPAKRRAKKR